MSNWSDLKNNPRLNEIYKKRLEITRLIREFFWSENFQEVETPVAVRLPGQEPYLNPIPVSFHDPHGAENKFYLQTSPEFAMKKLLAVGYEKIFQICKCFRDFEQFGGNHTTEFTMIEWYRAPGTLEEIMDDTEKLFKYVAGNIGVPEVLCKDKKVNVAGVWNRLSMREVWKKYIGMDLNDYLTKEKMSELVRERGFAVEASEPYEDLFYKIFLNEIEPKLGMEKPIMIYDYPEQMTSLSRISKKDPRYGERFELYIAGLELANAFGELTDAAEQKQRLEIDRDKRAQMGKETWPVDSDFISALESGIPNAGGIALGVDRMVMLFTGAKDINEVIFQAVGDRA
jgi:elongation factor P--(R)-beta-lysine ligase